MSFIDVLAQAPDTAVRIPTEEGCREALFDLGLAPEAFLAGSPPPGALRIQTFEQVPTHWVAVALLPAPSKSSWVLLAWPKASLSRQAFLSRTLDRRAWWPEAETSAASR